MFNGQLGGHQHGGHDNLSFLPSDSSESGARVKWVWTSMGYTRDLRRHRLMVGLYHTLRVPSPACFSTERGHGWTEFLAQTGLQGAVASASTKAGITSSAKRLMFLSAISCGIPPK